MEKQCLTWWISPYSCVVGKGFETTRTKAFLRNIFSMFVLWEILVLGRYQEEQQRRRASSMHRWLVHGKVYSPWSHQRQRHVHPSRAPDLVDNQADSSQLSCLQRWPSQIQNTTVPPSRRKSSRHGRFGTFPRCRCTLRLWLLGNGQRFLVVIAWGSEREGKITQIKEGKIHHDFSNSAFWDDDNDTFLSSFPFYQVLSYLGSATVRPAGWSGKHQGLQWRDRGMSLSIAARVGGVPSASLIFRRERPFCRTKPQSALVLWLWRKTWQEDNKKKDLNCSA